MPSDAVMLNKVAANLDKHLVLPLLQFAHAQTTDAAFKANLAESIAAVADQTSILSFEKDAEKLKTKQIKIDKKIEKLIAALGTAGTYYFTTEEGSTRLRLAFVGKEFNDAVRQGKFTKNTLREEKIDAKQVEAMYHAAFALVDIGDYEQAADILKVFNTIEEKKVTTELSTSALWGQYLCEVMLNRSDSSRHSLAAILEDLDEQAADQATTARVWALHWALFHYFKRRDTSGLLDLLFAVDRSDRSKSYLYGNIVQCLAPHLLRYAAVAAILNKKKRSVLRRVARLLESEAYSYSDAATQFVVELCAKSNLPQATKLLADCGALLAGDYFCADLKDEFIANAWQLLFEDELRMRKTLKIQIAADRLGMTIDKAELWLVDLIREAKIDASVDSVRGTVEVRVASSQKSIWQQVIDQLEVADRHGSATA